MMENDLDIENLDVNTLKFGDLPWPKDYKDGMYKFGDCFLTKSGLKLYIQKLQEFVDTLN